MFLLFISITTQCMLSRNKRLLINNWSTYIQVKLFKFQSICIYSHIRWSQFKEIYLFMSIWFNYNLLNYSFSHQINVRSFYILVSLILQILVLFIIWSVNWILKLLSVPWTKFCERHQGWSWGYLGACFLKHSFYRWISYRLLRSKIWCFMHIATLNI